MEGLAAGEVVVAPIPFSRLSRSKPRPTIMLAGAGRGDYRLCRVTSTSYAVLDAVASDHVMQQIRWTDGNERL